MTHYTLIARNPQFKMSPNYPNGKTAAAKIFPM